MDNKRLAEFVFEMGTLRKIARSHRQTFLSDDLSDNIATHSYLVSVISYFLAKNEKADMGRVLTMAIFHDSSEARSGDQNWIHKKYVKVFEDEILDDQMKDLTEDNDLHKTMTEYNARESLESKVVKDADRLAQYFLIKEYIMQGNSEAAKWIKDKSDKDLFTQTAKDLFNQLLITDPAWWWKNIYVEKRR